MKAILTIILIILGISANAQGINRAKLDSAFNIIEENQQGMGSISLFHKGEEIYQKTFGYADVENEIKANSTTKYRIGSISKTFTAVVIMQLIEDKKLKLDTPLSKFYPQIKNAKKITIEHLLLHRSGIFNITNSEDYFDWNTYKISEDDMLEKIKEKGVVFQPGTQFSYSNSGYILLTYIAEKVTGKSFAELVLMDICIPCGLNLTSYGHKIKPLENEALSYKKMKNWKLEAETDVTVPVGAGALISTSTELNKFLLCLFKENKLVKKKNLKKMKTLVDGFGMGMFTVPYNEKTGIGHTGGIDGFQSNSFYFEDEDFAISYLSNGVVMPVNDIILMPLHSFFGNDFDFPQFQPSVDVPEKTLQSYVGTYSAEGFPAKITITTEDGILIAQATSQPSFTLTTVSETEFVFKPASVKMIFNAEKKSMKFFQFGSEFELTKE